MPRRRRLPRDGEELRVCDRPRCEPRAGPTARCRPPPQRQDHRRLSQGVGLGWCGDYPNDPAFLLREVLVPAGPVGIESTKYRRRLTAALKLNGEARSRALGKLDVDVMRELAPLAVLSTYSNLYFFSSRVDPRSLVYQNVYLDWSIPALALK